MSAKDLPDLCGIKTLNYVQLRVKISRNGLLLRPNHNVWFHFKDRQQHKLKLSHGNDLTFHTDLKGPRTVSYRMFITTVWYEFVSIITVWPVSVKIGGEKPL